MIKRMLNREGRRCQVLVRQGSLDEGGAKEGETS